MSHRARESWRDKWAGKLFAQLLPWLPSGSSVTTVLAKGPLPDLVAQLQAELGAARLLDARRPKLDTAADPAAAAGGLSFPGTLPGLLAGLGALLMLDMA